MFERPQGGERAVLVSLDFGDADFRAKAAELRELALSAGLSVSATVEGRRQRPDPATLGMGFQCPSEKEQKRPATLAAINR